MSFWVREEYETHRHTYRQMQMESICLWLPCFIQGNDDKADSTFIGGKLRSFKVWSVYVFVCGGYDIKTKWKVKDPKTNQTQTHTHLYFIQSMLSKIYLHVFVKMLYVYAKLWQIWSGVHWTPQSFGCFIRIGNNKQQHFIYLCKGKTKRDIYLNFDPSAIHWK